MSEPALILKDVSKTINHTPIVQSISFNVRKGEIFGLLGPNGSGKTTIFRMIVQLIKKTEGAISFRGRPDSDFEYFMRHIGVIIEAKKPGLSPSFPACRTPSHSVPAFGSDFFQIPFPLPAIIRLHTGVR